MNKQFQDIPWHDAQLLRMNVIRSEQDSIELVIAWQEADNSTVCEPKEFCASIQFNNCYQLKADMNFGVMPPDSILEAKQIIESNEIDTLIAKWKLMGVNLENLRCYQITTNSTNSRIEIYCLGYDIYLT